MAGNRADAEQDRRKTMFFSISGLKLKKNREKETSKNLRQEFDAKVFVYD